VEISSLSQAINNFPRDTKVRKSFVPLFCLVEKAVLKPLDLGETYGVPLDRRVLFRRVTFTKSYHKVLIELSKKKK
jgi:hypothetical protein